MIERRERGYVAGGRGKPPSGKERGYNCDKLFQSGETASQMKIRLYLLLIERPQSRYGSKSKANNVYMECGCFVDLKIEMLDQKKSIVLGRLVRIRCPGPGTSACLCWVWLFQGSPRDVKTGLGRSGLRGVSALIG
jgi:hypothetical protein